MAAVLVLNQFATGVLLKFVYQPTVAGAYLSIVALQNEIVFGGLIRNLHYWGANLLLLIMLLHLLRVFFTSAYRSPRRASWIVGLGLLIGVLTANFSGYLLPWDQLAYWATTVWTSMLGYLPGIGEKLQQALRTGDEIGQASLQLFYTLHTAVVPLMLLALLPYHFWRIRKAGGLVLPRSPGEPPDPSPPRLPVWPDLLVREASTSLCLMALLMLLAVFFDAPLGDPANPGLSPNPTKAPWFMAGFQELLLHMHPVFAVLVIPLLGFAGLLALPFLVLPKNSAGVWFVSDVGRKTALIATVTALILTPFVIAGSDLFFRSNSWFTWAPPVLKEGLIPTVLLIAAAAGMYLVVGIQWKGDRNEAIQAVFTMLVVAWIVMTVISVWFRGEQMKLDWPWR
jgi:quinol-cytochrome oxidoreductase complex cytochrome b subunit